MNVLRNSVETAEIRLKLKYTMNDYFLTIE